MQIDISAVCKGYVKILPFFRIISTLAYLAVRSHEFGISSCWTIRNIHICVASGSSTLKCGVKHRYPIHPVAHKVFLGLPLLYYNVWALKFYAYLLAPSINILKRIRLDLSFAFSSGVINIRVSLGHEGFLIKSVNIVSWIHKKQRKKKITLFSGRESTLNGKGI